MDRGVADAIRQQSEDLRDELKELEQWEDSMTAREAAKAQRKNAANAVAATVEPPIRGTVPSLKDAVQKQQAATSITPAVDPIQQAKEKGNALFQVGNVQEAVTTYTTGIDLDPASATTHILYANRAMCYLKLGQWTSAEKDATTCVHMNTGYAKAYYRRAMARKELHKLKEARADLEAVLALAPKDTSAQQALGEVTKAIQAEREAAAASVCATPTAAKRRIVIEEVDSEDEETTAPASTAPKLSAEEQQIRQTRIDEDMKKLAAAREQREADARTEAQREAAVQQQRQRRNQRVEIIEEEEEVEQKVTAPTQQPPVQIKAASPPPSVPPAPTPVSALLPSSSSSSPSVSLPTAPRPRPSVSKEVLTAPKSFTEFERRFREVEQQPELRDHYVRLLDPSTLSKLFGSNMTPEMLVGILRSANTFDGPTALQFAKGLSQVSRVEDMTLFFNAQEKAVVQEVLDLLKSSGAAEKDIQAVRRKLKPF